MKILDDTPPRWTSKVSLIVGALPILFAPRLIAFVLAVVFIGVSAYMDAKREIAPEVREIEDLVVALWLNCGAVEEPGVGRSPLTTEERELLSKVRAEWDRRSNG